MRQESGHNLENVSINFSNFPLPHLRGNLVYLGVFFCLFVCTYNYPSEWGPIFIPVVLIVDPTLEMGVPYWKTVNAV